MKAPTRADVQSIADHYGLSLSKADSEGQLNWMSARPRGFQQSPICLIAFRNYVTPA